MSRTKVEVQEITLARLRARGKGPIDLARFMGCRYDRIYKILKGYEFPFPGWERQVEEAMEFFDKEAAKK